MQLVSAPPPPALALARAALLAAGGQWVDVVALAPEVLARVESAREDDHSSEGARLERVARDVATEALVAEARAGGPAMERLLDLWQGSVLRWCRLLCRPGVNPEDPAADTLMAVVTDLRRLEDPRRFRAWLWSVTWRTVRGYHRRAFLRRWVPGLVPERRDPAGDPGFRLELAERDAGVRAVLGQLSAEHTELLWLAYAEGLSRTELAAQLGMPAGTLNRKLSQARASFERHARAAGLAPEDGALALGGAEP